jgi:predicted transposase YbfD/YdcC
MNSDAVVVQNSTTSTLEQLVNRFQTCPDFRRADDKKVHELVDIIVLALCAVIGGANSWLSVERFATSHETWFRTFLSLSNGIPSHDTFRRIFLLLDPQILNERFSTWLQEISDRLPPKQIAIDGKTLRGSKDSTRGLTALHMVHAFAVDYGVCVGQCATEAKSNEITAIPELLQLLNMKGALVTIDAMGCPTAIAEAIVDQEGDYVFTVKDNQPNLHADIQTIVAPLLNHPVPPTVREYAQTEEMNRGRWEKRTCYTTTNIDSIRNCKQWKNLRLVGVIVSERIVNGKRETETRHFISSRILSAQQLLNAVRSHWLVENVLHWSLDVVFGEDAHQLAVGYGPENFTTLRTLAHALIKKGNPKDGIKGTRERAGWDVRVLERIIQESTILGLKTNA